VPFAALRGNASGGVYVITCEAKGGWLPQRGVAGGRFSSSDKEKPGRIPVVESRRNFDRFRSAYGLRQIGLTQRSWPTTKAHAPPEAITRRHPQPGRQPRTATCRKPSRSKPEFWSSLYGGH